MILALAHAAPVLIGAALTVAAFVWRIEPHVHHDDDSEDET